MKVSVVVPVYVDGMVIPNRDEGLAEAILKLYNNRQILEEYRINLKLKDFSNAEKLEEFYRIID